MPLPTSPVLVNYVWILCLKCFDLRPPKSNEFIFESWCRSVPNLKKFLRGNLEISHSRSQKHVLWGHTDTDLWPLTSNHQNPLHLSAQVNVCTKFAKFLVAVTEISRSQEWEWQTIVGIIISRITQKNKMLRDRRRRGRLTDRWRDKSTPSLPLFDDPLRAPADLEKLQRGSDGRPLCSSNGQHRTNPLFKLSALSCREATAAAAAAASPIVCLSSVS